MFKTVLSPLRAQRLQLGLSQVALSKITGISQPKISALELGKRPTPEELKVLLIALKLEERDSWWSF